jgi:tetratricopeptide (TPR) repeat protein
MQMVYSVIKEANTTADEKQKARLLQARHLFQEGEYQTAITVFGKAKNERKSISVNASYLEARAYQELGKRNKDLSKLASALLIYEQTLAGKVSPSMKEAIHIEIQNIYQFVETDPDIQAIEMRVAEFETSPLVLCLQAKAFRKAGEKGRNLSDLATAFVYYNRAIEISEKQEFCQSAKAEQGKILAFVESHGGNLQEFHRAVALIDKIT